jgi:hypothetical protein
MDIIMQEYRSMPAGSTDFSLGGRRDFTPMAGGGTYNDRGNLGNMGLRQSMAAQAPTGTSPITPGLQSAAPMMPPSVPLPPPRPSTYGVLPQFESPGLASPAIQRAAFERMLAEGGIATPKNPMDVSGANTPVVAGLDTTNRPAPMASSVTAPARPQGFFEQLFKGPQYQSNNALLQAEGQPINWGQAMTPQLMPDKKISMTPSYIPSDSAADFFRADALLQQQNPSFFGLLGGNNG